MQKNPVVFRELATQDMEKSVQFFQEVFEWNIEFSERLGFYIIPQVSPPDEPLDGAIFTLKRAKLPFVAVYIQVENIDEKAKMIDEKGGLVIDPPSELPSGSKICLFNDPSGVTFAMLQPKTKSEE